MFRSGELHGLVHAPEDPFRHAPVPPADEPYPHAHSVQLVPPPGEQVVGNHTQEETDLRMWPPPVLRRKGVHRKPLEAELDCPLRRIQQSFLAGSMTLGTRQAAPGGPATVPVHDTRHVTRYPLRVEPGQVHWTKSYLAGP